MSKSSRAADVTQSRFSTNCEFFALTRKNEGNPFFIVEIFLWFSRVRPYIASYLVWTKIFEVFNAKWSQDKFLIDWTGKYLALGHDARTSLRPLLAGSPYVMTSSQILFYAFLLDHLHYFHTYLFSFREFLFSSIVAAKEHQDQVKSQ